jgi:ubiquinone/menaquinone biosynthesis C-methylase UbiE
MSIARSLEYLSNPNPQFEQRYVEVRAKEGRILSDSQVAQLPITEETYVHAAEWKKRVNTLKLFSTYLNNRKAQAILAVGCGNGWFTNRIAPYCAEITGLDVNTTELEQADQLFENDKIKFIYAELFTAPLPLAKYDIIVFNASIQYFPDLKALLNRCKDLLIEDGEIHILDSPFYDSASTLEAKERTDRYFKSIGAPEAASYYFHHDKAAVNTFNSEIVYKPTFFTKLITKHYSPFPWIRIRK